MKQNTEVLLNTAVQSMITFIKENVQNNLALASRERMFEIDDNSLQRVIAVTLDSIDQGFIRSHVELETAIKKLD